MCDQVHCTCDECLQTRLNASDPTVCSDAWGDWYARDLPTVHAFVRRRLVEPVRDLLTDDITQDVFITGYQLITGGRYPAQGNNLCALLIGIAKKHMLRARYSRNLLLRGLDENNELHAAGLAPDDALIVSDVQHKVMQLAIEDRTGGQAILFALYAHKRTAQMVASDMSMTETNVRVIAHRSVRRIVRGLHHHFELDISPDAVRLCLENLEEGAPILSFEEPLRHRRRTARAKQSM